jgi:hypothetical protein
MFWSRAIKAAALSVVISIVCVLPPGIHFVTGPLGPLIGGYFAGSKTRVIGYEAALVGLLLTVLVGVPASFILRELGDLAAIPVAAVLFFAVVGALYFGRLGGIAAWFGGRAARHEQPS